MQSALLIKEHIPKLSNHRYRYYTIIHLKLLNLLPNWELIIKSDELVTLNKVMPIFIIPYEIFIDPLLSFTVKCFAFTR